MKDVVVTAPRGEGAPTEREVATKSRGTFDAAGTGAETARDAARRGAGRGARAGTARGGARPVMTGVEKDLESSRARRENDRIRLTPEADSVEVTYIFC